jgi:hypothetical protein
LKRVSNADSKDQWGLAPLLFARREGHEAVMRLSARSLSYAVVK